jgi:DNA polymerase V
MYLCKIAMDIVAKHIPADKDGVRIAELNELSYRQQLWNHRPLTSFWRVGQGTAAKLAAIGIETMGQIARLSLQHEELLYRMFGVNAELLIDHAWGWEPCTIDYIKSYRPATNSISSGQVLQSPYTFKKARIVVEEMADALSLQLVERRIVTNKMTLTIGYDRESLANPDVRAKYHGEIRIDHYGRQVPKYAHGTATPPEPTSSSKMIIDAILDLYDRIVNPLLLVRRITIAANVILETSAAQKPSAVQLDLFTDYKMLEYMRISDRNQEAYKIFKLQ